MCLRRLSVLSGLFAILCADGVVLLSFLVMSCVWGDVSGKYSGAELTFVSRLGMNVSLFG